MRVELTDEELRDKGLEIGVTGFKHDRRGTDSHPTQVYLEHKGKLQVHIWDGEQEPCITVCIDPLDPLRVPTETKAKLRSPGQVAVQVANALSHADAGVIERIANQLLKRKVAHLGEDAFGQPIFEQEIEK